MTILNIKELTAKLPPISLTQVELRQLHDAVTTVQEKDTVLDRWLTDNDKHNYTQLASKLIKMMMELHHD